MDFDANVARVSDFVNSLFNFCIPRSTISMQTSIKWTSKALKNYDNIVFDCDGRYIDNIYIL